MAQHKMIMVHSHWNSNVLKPSQWLTHGLNKWRFSNKNQGKLECHQQPRHLKRYDSSIQIQEEAYEYSGVKYNRKHLSSSPSNNPYCIICDAEQLSTHFHTPL